jgi:hypothetical protein
MAQTSQPGRETAMTTAMAQVPKATIVYPDSDGKPLADDTKQARWIMVLFGNLEALLRDHVAFVAANLLWYAREDFPEECAAPGVFVAFGRPPGDRRSSKQWEEGEVAPQVVFEGLSPTTTPEEMEKKEHFYEKHGIEEYYIYEPRKDVLNVYFRKGNRLCHRWVQKEFVSPRLGIHVDLSGPEMQVFYPDGRQFLTLEELEAERAREARPRMAEVKLHIVEQKVRRLAELSRKARLGQATSEEVAELERLENETP